MTETQTGFQRRRKEQQIDREKSCPWCGEDFTADSFRCTPSDIAPQNMEIGCVNSLCAFGKGKPLPVLTVDDAIYRRLPAFLIATVDKFAGLPFVDKVGAFFDHVDREDEHGFHGAAEPGLGRRLFGGARLLPPSVIIQDELHLISGPLGTVAALYEVALDRLASRRQGDRIVRPKIVASTATVRRADTQIRALFDRPRTAIFPPGTGSPQLLLRHHRAGRKESWPPLCGARRARQRPKAPVPARSRRCSLPAPRTCPWATPPIRI